MGRTRAGLKGHYVVLDQNFKFLHKVQWIEVTLKSFLQELCGAFGLIILLL